MGDIIETVIMMVIIKIVVTVAMIAMTIIGGVESACRFNFCNGDGWSVALAFTKHQYNVHHQWQKRTDADSDQDIGRPVHTQH